MTDDTIWENASIGDRCEILRRKFQDTPSGQSFRMLNAKIEILSARLSDIEKTPDIVIGEPLAPAPVVPVYPEELARLKRIEAAAMELERRRIPGMPWSDLYEPIEALSKALRS